MATKLRILVGTLLALGFVLAPSTAHAKGSRTAEVSGPGLDRPIYFENGGTEGPQLTANELGQTTGLFAALSPEATGSLNARRPEGELGPRYTVTYEYMVGQDEYEPVRQELYPFASEGPITYTPRGQRLFDEPVLSGWYRPGPQLRTVLLAAGVPAKPTVARASSPSDDVRDAIGWARAGLVGVAATSAIAVLVTFLVLRSRRRAAFRFR